MNFREYVELLVEGAIFELGPRDRYPGALSWVHATVEQGVKGKEVYLRPGQYQVVDLPRGPAGYGDAKTTDTLANFKISPVGKPNIVYSVNRSEFFKYARQAFNKIIPQQKIAQPRTWGQWLLGRKPAA